MNDRACAAEALDEVARSPRRLTQRVFSISSSGSRRASPTISSTFGSLPSASTTLVPTLPVAPVITTRIPMGDLFPRGKAENPGYPSKPVFL